MNTPSLLRGIDVTKEAVRGVSGGSSHPADLGARGSLGFRVSKMDLKEKSTNLNEKLGFPVQANPAFVSARATLRFLVMV